MISAGYIFNHNDLTTMYLKNNSAVKYLLDPKYNQNLFDPNLTRILDIAIYKNDREMISRLKRLGCKIYKHHKTLMKIYMGREIQSDFDFDDIILSPKDILNSNKGLIEIKYMASSLCLDLNDDYSSLCDQISNKKIHNNNKYLNDTSLLGNDIKYIPDEKLITFEGYAFETYDICEILKTNKISPYTRNKFIISNTDKYKIDLMEKHKSLGYCIPITDVFTLNYEKLQYNDVNIPLTKSLMYVNNILSQNEALHIKTLEDLNVVYNILKFINPIVSDSINMLLTS